MLSSWKVVNKNKINLDPLKPDEDKTFSGSLVLDLRIDDVTCTHFIELETESAFGLAKNLDDSDDSGADSDYNLGQNKWNIWTTPPPHFNDAKMARFALRASSSLLRGGGG